MRAPPEAQLNDPQLNRVMAKAFQAIPKNAESRLATAEDELSTAQDSLTSAQEDIETNTAAIANKLQTASYTERWDDITHSTGGAWTEVDLTAYGVEAGDICEILIHANSWTNKAGVRTLGSSLNRYVDEVPDESSFPLDVVAGTGAVIELWMDDASDFNVYLTGYWRFSTS